MSMVNEIKARLAAASPRERRLLGIAALVVGIGLLLSIGDWAHRERQRLVSAVPGAEARLARMQEQADELGRLRRAAPPPAAATPVRAAAARAAAEARGLQIAIDELPDGLVVSGRGEAVALLDWLAAMQAEQQLRPIEVELRSESGQIQVDGRLVAVDSGPAR